MIVPPPTDLIALEQAFTDFLLTIGAVGAALVALHFGVILWLTRRPGEERRER